MHFLQTAEGEENYSQKINETSVQRINENIRNDFRGEKYFFYYSII